MKNSEATDKVAQESTENTVNEIMTEDPHEVVADKTAKNISEAPVKETTADNTFKAVETQKPDAPTEKFKCNQCEYENLSEKGLAHHNRMKHCPWLELRCSKREHIAHKGT